MRQPRVAITPALPARSRFPLDGAFFPQHPSSSIRKLSLCGRRGYNSSVKQTESQKVVAAEVMVSGRVQGVCYRAFAQEAALDLGLGGWVRNLPDGRVEAQVEGPRGQIEKLLDLLRTGPPRALVTDLKINWKASARGSQHFEIVD
jgi:acylphosphatase